MLSNITLTNKTTIDPNKVITPTLLPDGRELKVFATTHTNPITFARLNARDNPTLTENTLIINLDGKNYLTNNLSAVFKPGSNPVTFSIKDLIELDSDTVLYDIPSHPKDDFGITLEIEGGKDNTNVCHGFDIGPVKFNGTPLGLSSLELFTEDNQLKANVKFIISNIKFNGKNVTTEATYYQEKQPNLVKYVFKPNKILTTNYSDLVFYIDINVETQDNINKKLDEAVSNNWKLYSINDITVDI